MTEIMDNNQRPTTLAPASLFNQDISKRCDAVIEKYCEGTIDKVDALFAIRDILVRPKKVRCDRIQVHSITLSAFAMAL